MTSSVSFGAWILTQLLTSKPAMGAERTEFSCSVFVHVFWGCVLLVRGRAPGVQLASNSLRSLGLGTSEPVYQPTLLVLFSAEHQPRGFVPAWEALHLQRHVRTPGGSPECRSSSWTSLGIQWRCRAATVCWSHWLGLVRQPLPRGCGLANEQS